eukprot:111947-Chlamydomonas_euryale.AAC.1
MWPRPTPTASPAACTPCLSLQEAARQLFAARKERAAVLVHSRRKCALLVHLGAHVVGTVGGVCCPPVRPGVQALRCGRTERS